MKSLLKRHRIRASFYHIVALIYVNIVVATYFELVSDNAAFWIGVVLFVVDYLAEMYDPHPESPGPWFKSHFHRFYDGDEDDD